MVFLGCAPYLVQAQTIRRTHTRADTCAHATHTYTTRITTSTVSAGHYTLRRARVCKLAQARALFASLPPPPPIPMAMPMATARATLSASSATADTSAVAAAAIANAAFAATHDASHTTTPTPPQPRRHMLEPPQQPLPRQQLPPRSPPPCSRKNNGWRRRSGASTNTETDRDSRPEAGSHDRDRWRNAISSSC